MSLTPIPAAEALQQLDRFDTIIDARTEAEFDEDHLPAALNWPTLSNAQRIEVGTMYKQINAFEAKKRGAAMAAAATAVAPGAAAVSIVERCLSAAHGDLGDGRIFFRKSVWQSIPG